MEEISTRELVLQARRATTANDQDGCWGSVFPAPPVRKDAAQFKDKLQ